jgi:hypothetical protein
MALDRVSFIATTTVTPGSYTSANITVNSEGLVTAASNGSSSSFPAGTVWSFAQAAAPTGWTQVTTYNNVGVRIVSGVGGGSGGSIAFSTLFSLTSSYTGSINITSGTVGNTTLSTAQLATHSHTLTLSTVGNFNCGGGAYFNSCTDAGGSPAPAFSSTGGDASHTHSLVGTAAAGNFTSDFNLQYVDVILASKN